MKALPLLAIPPPEHAIYPAKRYMVFFPTGWLRCNGTHVHLHPVKSNKPNTYYLNTHSERLREFCAH